MMTRGRFFASSLLACTAVTVAGCPDDTTQFDPFGETATSGATLPTSGTGGDTDATSGTPPTTSVGSESDSNSSESQGSTGNDSNNTTDPSGGSTTGDPTTGGTGDDTGGSTTGPMPDCLMDTDCPAGQICDNEVCVEGCSAMQPCPNGDACCEGVCTDTNIDINNCMACGEVCPDTENAEDSCEAGVCTVGECDLGFFDCDGAAGCESEVECTCTPDAVQNCYPADPATEDVGECHGGTQTCNAAGTAWGACTGFQIPQAEFAPGNCTDGLDNDCNGVADDVDDIDGDGWTVCNGDCCENEFECSQPTLVNPGAFEFVGNDVDDDCDPATSDDVPAAFCSNIAVFGGVDGEDIARAMDLCQFTTEAEPLPTRKWGVISAELVMPDGSAPPGSWLNEMMSWQTAVMQNYGTGGVVPTLGPTMGGISTGRMRDQNDPGYVNPATGTDFGNDSTPPPSYLAAHGGSLPASQGCSGNCPAGSGGSDPIGVRLRIRVPTNAQSFRYRFRFFSAEHWRWQCTEYNDFYLALLESNAMGIPLDGNISFDSLGNAVSVNNGFYEICEDKGCNTCPGGTGPLAGTGMQLLISDLNGQVGAAGGGTVWLETTAPVVPGETIELTLITFDVSDNIWDSLVLLDAFEWDVDPSDVGTDPQ